MQLKNLILYLKQVLSQNVDVTYTFPFLSFAATKRKKQRKVSAN
jgi:hypothetical protein